jgi:O-methyltransferase domain
MKFQFVPENPIEEHALQSNPAIKPLFEPFMPVLQSRCIISANRLGVFEAIGHDQYTVVQLAEKLSLDPECLELLLRMLISAGYVSCQNSHYSLPDNIKATLLPDSPMRLTSWMEHNYRHWHVIDHLEEVIKSGVGIDDHKNLDSPEKWRIYQEAMLDTARLAASAVASCIPVRDDAKKMLDIGGSHGLYGAMICRMHPPMKSDVLELPDAALHACKLAHDERIDDIVSHRSCNVLNDDLGSGYDLAFFSNIIHHFSDDQNRDLLKRTHDALSDNATIAIWDFKTPGLDSPPDLIGDGFALMFRISSNSKCYTSKDYYNMLETAGFTDIIAHPIPAPSQILITGRKD